MRILNTLRAGLLFAIAFFCCLTFAQAQANSNATEDKAQVVNSEVTPPAAQLAPEVAEFRKKYPTFPVFKDTGNAIQDAQKHQEAVNAWIKANPAKFAQMEKDAGEAQSSAVTRKEADQR